MTLPRPIGLVSGLGPLAGSDVLDKLILHTASAYAAVDDADYPDVVMISHGISDFDATGSMSPTFEAELVEIVDELEAHHPLVLGLACNTAHLALPAVRAHTSAHVIDLIEEVARCAATSRPDLCYLLVSSSATRRAGLYRSRLQDYGVRFVEVSDHHQAQLDNVIRLVMGHNLDAAARQIIPIINDAALGCDGVIAGCTELPLALDRTRIPDQIPVIDSNRVLAETLVDSYFRLLGQNHLASALAS